MRTLLREIENGELYDNMINCIYRFLEHSSAQYNIIL